jgi:adenylate cyclase class IV
VAENIEIKARVRDASRARALAEAVSGGPPVLLEQEDTFFNSPRGRLKLRVLAPDRGELILYDRPDAAGPKRSLYHVVPTARPDLVREALATALGVVGVVRKTRRLYGIGRTRIHIDDVEGLGCFLELEVMMKEGEPAAEGEAIARDLMSRLEVREDDLVPGAYVDLAASCLRGAPRSGERGPGGPGAA